MNGKTERSTRVNRLWLGLLAGVACYVLSTGPVIRLYVQTQDPALRRTFAALYSPLRLLEETRAGTALGTWIRWCCEFPPAVARSAAPAEARF